MKDDTISRMAAVDALDRLEYTPGEWATSGLTMCKDAIKELPSAQPSVTDTNVRSRATEADDLINRKDTIRAIEAEKVAHGDYTTSSYVGYEFAEEVVESMPSAQQWIPCTPKTMPKMSAMTETYLVKVGINECGEGMHTEVRTADWYSSSKMWNVHESEKSIVGEVTAWMPAPNM